jgi:hypothetical protein
MNAPVITIRCTWAAAVHSFPELKAPIGSGPPARGFSADGGVRSQPPEGSGIAMASAG